MPGKTNRMLLLIAICCFSCTKPRPLEFIQAFKLSGIDKIEPSGLTLSRGSLYTVSDNHDEIIFKIHPLADSSWVEASIFFQAPLLPGESGKLDFEGIDSDSAGNFYLVSESRYRILKVSPSGQAKWISPNIQPLGVEKGLFQKNNAALEGLARIGSDRFVLCAERQPRGILWLDLSENSRGEFLINPMDHTKVSTPLNRVPDFSDLHRYNGEIFVLERFASLIRHLVRTERQTLERECWSFAEIENDSRFRYQDMTFGHAEGFCMDADHTWIVLDNNGDPLENEPTDCRPWLFVFKTPPFISSKSQ